MIAAVRREARLIASEPAGWILLAVYAAFLAYGAVQGVVSVRQERAQIEKSRAEYAERWRSIEHNAGAESSQVWGSWRSASLAGSEVGGAVAWLEPGQLGALNRGHASRENAVRRISLYDSPVEPPLANPINAMYGWMDVGFTVLWLLPLVLLLLAFQSVGRDRELGVWPLVLASGVSPRTLIPIRLFIPAAAAILLTVLFGLAAVAATSGAFGGAFLVWVLTLGLYGSFWTMLGGFVGLSAHAPVRQLLILGGIWVAAVWVGPGLMEAVTGLTVPKVSRVEGLLAAREAQLTAAERSAILMKSVYEQHPEWRPSPDLATRMNQPVPGGPRRRDARNVYANYLIGEEATRPFAQALASRQLRIEVLANRLSVASPLTGMQYLTEELAGASPGKYIWFSRQAERFLAEWRAFFAGKIWRLEEMKVSDIVRRPQFRSETEPVALWKQRVIWPAAGLVFWLAVAALLLYRKLDRYST